MVTLRETINELFHWPLPFNSWIWPYNDFKCWNDEYIILCNDGGGRGPPKTPRVAERKQNPVWVWLMVNVCQFSRRKKHLCSSRCWGNYCWLRNWEMAFGRSVNNTASCFKTLKGDRVSFLFFIMRKDKPSQIRRVHYVDFFTGVISSNCVYFDI